MRVRPWTNASNYQTVTHNRGSTPFSMNLLHRLLLHLKGEGIVF